MQRKPTYQCFVARVYELLLHDVCQHLFRTAKVVAETVASNFVLKFLQRRKPCGVSQPGSGSQQISAPIESVELGEGVFGYLGLDEAVAGRMAESGDVTAVVNRDASCR